MYGRVSVCTCLRTHARTHVQTYVHEPCTKIRSHLRLHIYIYECKPILAHPSLPMHKPYRTNASLFWNMDVCMGVHLDVRVGVNMLRSCTRTCSHTCTCARTCAYVSVYICIYLSIHRTVDHAALLLVNSTSPAASLSLLDACSSRSFDLSTALRLLGS